MKRLSCSDLFVGQSHSSRFCIDENQVNQFIALTGDNAAIHVDHEEAVRRGFRGRLAHGLLINSFYSTILGCQLPGANFVIAQIQTNLLHPVYIGDTLEYTVCVNKVSLAVNSVFLQLSVLNQQAILVNQGNATCVYR